MSEEKPSFSMEKVVDMLFPVLLAAVAWLLGEITSFQNRLIAIESKIPILITEDGVPTDSPFKLFALILIAILAFAGYIVYDHDIQLHIMVAYILS